MDEDSLRQKANGKRNDAARHEVIKADLTRSHEATIDAYNKEITSLQGKIDLEKGLLERDAASSDAAIQRLNAEAEQYDAQADAARESAENQRKAAAAAAILASQNQNNG